MKPITICLCLAVATWLFHAPPIDVPPRPRPEAATDHDFEAGEGERVTSKPAKYVGFPRRERCRFIGVTLDTNYMTYNECFFESCNVSGDSRAVNSVFRDCDTESLQQMLDCTVYAEKSKPLVDLGAQTHPDSTSEEYLKALKEGGEIWKDGHKILIGDPSSQESPHHEQ